MNKRQLLQTMFRTWCWRSKRLGCRRSVVRAPVIEMVPSMRASRAMAAGGLLKAEARMMTTLPIAVLDQLRVLDPTRVGVDGGRETSDDAARTRCGGERWRTKRLGSKPFVK